jgi:hypothetical protein
MDGLAQTWFNLAELIKCFHYLYLSKTKVRKIKNWDSQNTLFTQVNSK